MNTTPHLATELKDMIARFRNVVMQDLTPHAFRNVVMQDLTPHSFLSLQGNFHAVMQMVRACKAHRDCPPQRPKVCIQVHPILLACAGNPQNSDPPVVCIVLNQPHEMDHLGIVLSK